MGWGGELGGNAGNRNQADGRIRTGQNKEGVKEEDLITYPKVTTSIHRF